MNAPKSSPSSGRIPSVITLLPQRFEDGAWSGVPRFDWELRQAIPEIQAVRSIRTPKWILKRLSVMRNPNTIVIAVNEDSMYAPERIRTIVVHHGCAQTHFDRDPEWRGMVPRRWCQIQRDMYRLKNRWYVSVARWTAEQFSAHYEVPVTPIIPSWVEPIHQKPKVRDRKVVLGDWRTFNKGSKMIEKLKVRMPHLEFRTLNCTYQNRAAWYADADCYLCLSLSEGGSFAVSDAEAASLPLITTDVGNYVEYNQSYVIPWQRRDDVELLAATIDRALGQPRGPSFFESWTKERWIKAWRDLIEEVASSPGREPLIKD